MWKQLKNRLTSGYEKIVYCNYCDNTGHFENNCLKKEFDKKQNDDKRAVKN